MTDDQNAKLICNGQEVMRGDPATMRIVRNNLTGENFLGRPNEHAEYLAYMRSQWQIPQELHTVVVEQG